MSDEEKTADLELRVRQYHLTQSVEALPTLPRNSRQTALPQPLNERVNRGR